MKLRVNELQSVVADIVKGEKIRLALRDELFRVLGPAVMVSESPDAVFKCSNEHLDVLEGTGRFPKIGSFCANVLLEASTNGDENVRKLAARLLPPQHSKKFLSDKSSAVRCAAAARSHFADLCEAVSRFGKDDQLQLIARQRLTESGLPDPKPQNVKTSEDWKKLSVAARQQRPSELHKEWYKRLAHHLVNVYGTNLERQWEEILAQVYGNAFNSFRIASDINFDKKKLLDEIYACLEERDEKVIEEGYFRRMASELRAEELNENFMPVISEDVDVVTRLVESGMGQIQYLEEAEKIFQIKKAQVPSSLRKYRLEEAPQTTQVPIKGRIPSALDSTTERALDTYVKHWNSRQEMRGEPFRLSWSPDPGDFSLVGFSLELK